MVRFAVIHLNALVTLRSSIVRNLLPGATDSLVISLQMWYCIVGMCYACWMRQLRFIRTTHRRLYTVRSRPYAMPVYCVRCRRPSIGKTSLLHQTGDSTVHKHQCPEKTRSRIHLSRSPAIFCVINAALQVPVTLRPDDALYACSLLQYLLKTDYDRNSRRVSTCTTAFSYSLLCFISLLRR